MNEGYTGTTYIKGETVFVDGTIPARVAYNTHDAAGGDYRVVVTYPDSAMPGTEFSVARERVARERTPVEPAEPLYQFSLTATPQLKHWNGRYDVWRDTERPLPVTIGVFAPDRESAEAKATKLLPPLRTDARWKIEVAAIEEVA